MKKITSFTSHVTGEGTRLSATYSVINEDGQITKSNERFNIVVIDEQIQQAIDTINTYLGTKIPAGE